MLSAVETEPRLLEGVLDRIWVLGDVSEHVLQAALRVLLLRRGRSREGACKRLQKGAESPRAVEGVELRVHYVVRDNYGLYDSQEQRFLVGFRFSTSTPANRVLVRLLL